MSILSDVKKDIGDSSDSTEFDETLIRYINTVFGILAQLGSGPEKGFKITGYEEEWEDFFVFAGFEDRDDLNMIKTYVQNKVKFMYDNPPNASYANAIKEINNELEWRINAAVDFQED